MKANQKNYNDSINQKLSRNKSNLGKTGKKSRNSSKNSLSRHGDPETKTYTSVLHKKSKERLSKNIMIGSPEENKCKFLSDKTNKSSLTSSTTTHTNNRKKRG